MADRIPWLAEASLWVGTKYLTRGTLAELAFLYRADVPDDRKWTAYLAGNQLPILHEADRPHMMQHGGLEQLVKAYERDRPAHR